MALRDILQGTGIIDQRDDWIAGATHLIQMGDLFDRGGGVCAALDLLQRLQRDAPKSGGRVTMLLGNHEVMAIQGDRRWCSADEFLWFASDGEREAWPERIKEARGEIAARMDDDTPAVLLELRLNQWKHRNAPGRDELWRALEPDGWIGQAVRSLPVAVTDQGCIFSHAGLTPRWARLGIDGVNRAAQDAWSKEPDSDDIFHSVTGPLWNRELVLGSHEQVRGQLAESLDALGMQRMIVGHTPTANIPGCDPGRIAILHDGCVVGLDVGLDRDTPGAALIIEEDGRGFEWTPTRTSELWSG